MYHTRLIICCVAASLAFSIPKAAGQAALPPPAMVSRDEAPKRFFNLFIPFRTTLTALSPDGKFLAYSLREEEKLSVVIVEIDSPAKAKVKVAVISDEQATPMAKLKDKEKTPAQIRWMGWVTPTRLVVETNRVFPVTFGEPSIDSMNPASTSAASTIAAVPADISTDPLFINVVGEIWAFDADGQNARSILKPRDIPEGIPYQSGKQRQLARAPHIVDYAGDDPNCVIVQADGIVRPNSLRRVERFKLNVNNATLTELGDYTITSHQNYLFDREGKPRIAIPISVHDAFPHVITYDSGTTLNRWKPLDQLAATSGRAAFNVSPNNYFGERSVPLGFDYDSNLLYFASNSGRDTFGLYGLDMTTGKLSHLSAENPGFDMYNPGPGIFPDSLVFSLFGREDPALATETAETSGTSTVLGDWENNMSTTAGADADSAVGSRVSTADLISRAEIQGRAAPIIGRIDGYPLVYDRFQRKAVGFRMEGWTYTTRWFSPNFQAVQRDIESTKPGCSVQIESWDSAHQRFLVKIDSVTDSGAYYIYEPTKKKLRQFVARAPWQESRKQHDTTMFSFTAPQGHDISGLFTFPRAARTVPVPVIVLCSSQPWSRVHTEYQAEVLSYADMGFAVVQVNTRGAWGFGVKQRDGIRNGFEDAQIADISMAIDYLSRGFAINAKRVAIAGDGFGGYLALRSIQLEPKKFRCAIAIDTIIDLQGWVAESRWSNGDPRPQFIQHFLGGADRLKSSPLLTKPETITNPILLLSYRGPGGSLEPSAYIDARKLARAVSSKDVTAEIFDLTDDYMAGLPYAKSEAFRKIEDFLNVNIYNYQVKSGELKIIKED